MKKKLPPLPESAFEFGEVELHDIPEKSCDHYFMQDGNAVVCKNCENVWPGLAKHVRVVDGEMILASSS